MSKFNIIACDKKVLRFLTAEKGHKLLYLDFNSVEPTLLAHFSQDPTYMKIYGPDANPNHCVYIYVGMHLAAFREKFAPYYDLENPTPEGVAYIKDKLADDRFVCKQGHLSMQYGAKPTRVHSELTLKNVKSSTPQALLLPENERPLITPQECEDFYNQYWKLFSTVVQYKQGLEYEWEHRGGYILNGRGRPLPLFRADKVDLLSRMIQSTAHDYLLRYLWHVNLLRKKHKTQMRPWLADLHDATTWEAPDSAIEEAKWILLEALQHLNDELNLTVTLKGKVKVSQNFSVAS